ncbi:hypothetical protein pb186bvf_004455 [Paramecium bursaria]
MIIKKALQKPESSFKVEIRKLPPLLTAQEFYSTITEFQDNIVYKYFVRGMLKEKETHHSRCYLYFKTSQLMREFIQKYSKVFCDDKGNYYKPLIQKALFQNQNTLQPIEKNIPTFEKSQWYQEFLQQKDGINLPIEQENQQEEKKKFEKVKTQIVLQLEQDHQKEQQIRDQIDDNSSNIKTFKLIENGVEVVKTFIFVPKAKD